ncbi:hypothetical protein AO439_000049, partial [Nakaseomyces glabratus]
NNNNGNAPNGDDGSNGDANQGPSRRTSLLGDERTRAGQAAPTGGSSPDNGVAGDTSNNGGAIVSQQVDDGGAGSPRRTSILGDVRSRTTLNGEVLNFEGSGVRRAVAGNLALPLMMVGLVFSL